MTGCATQVEEFSTGNDILILNEIRHALKKLIDSGETTTIDLRALPMAPGELDRIEEMLGKGEISATLDALGQSTIVETRASGVWLITHLNTEGETLGKYIEISPFPHLLRAHEEDMQNGYERICHQINDLTN